MSKEINKAKLRLNRDIQKIERMQLYSRYLDLQQKILDSLDIAEINLLSDCYRVFGINSIHYSIEDLVTQYHIKLL